ncbi:FAD binding domain-containing protein [Veillonella intestinalis]|uniref:FAD binding domain-containing protein n=1 Tax=Veillonella intestinalis TaxID=2941341 RepID=UPI002041FF14|nr:FAD binding domain-containing protein [Veillonella intestinalis]
MLMYRQLLQPKTVAEAYDLAMKYRFMPLLAGGAWIGLGSWRWPMVIDMSGLGLDYIRENDTYFAIGAMATQGDVERFEPFQTFGNGVLPKVVHSVLGVQFRNMATMGGSVAARFGFSDIIPSLLALQADVVLYKHGIMSLTEFLALRERDVLVEIRIPKTKAIIAAENLRKSVSDFPYLTGALRKDETGYHLYIGCRPAVAREAVQAGEILTAKGTAGLTEAMEAAAREIPFQTNSHASSSYRQAMTKVIVKRLVQEVEQWT